ncbi:MAG: cupredoxin domain-containing protein [Candidatus Vogelbacteria bacterium]|nr:cupredoxin domain-containing protein [Candidatus Vogelbacteria bacterium]
MNKYVILIILAAVIIGAGVVYRGVIQDDAAKGIDTGVVRELTVIAKKNEWRFVPEEFEVNQGDTIKMTAINEDDYDHGIAIEAAGVSQKMPANSTVTFEFKVTKAGDYPFYCSVPCGEGEVNGVHRGHVDMIGVIHARSLVETE